MSNTDNIYNILNNFNKIAKDAPAPVAATPKAKTKLQESMEQVVNEKYMGFKKAAAAGKKLGEGQDMMKNFFVILDDSLIDQIANMDGAEVDPDAGTVETWNENTARQLAAFAQKNPNRLQRKQSMNTAGMKPMAQRADGSSTGPEYGLKEGKKLNEKAANPYAVGMAVAKKKAGITAKPAHDLPKKVVKKAHEIAKKIDEGQDATTYTVAYKDPKKPSKSHSTQVKATSAAEAKAAFQEWDTTNRFTYLGSRPDVDKVYEDHGPENPDALVNYGEYDREGDMAKDDLYTIDSAAEELYSILQADDNLPEWVQSKITKAVDYLDTARDYMKAQSYGQGVAEGYDPVESDFKSWVDITRKETMRDGKTNGANSVEIMARYGGDDMTDIIRNILAYVKQNRQELGREVSEETGRTVKDCIIDIRNEFPQEYQAAQQPQGVAEGSSENKYSNLSNRGVNRGINRAGDDFNRMMDLDQVESPHYKTQHQQDTKQRLKTKPMTGPKGVLPEQGMAEGEDSKEIGPGWKTEHGIVDRVEGNSVIVKTSKGKMRVNMHDIKTAEAPEQDMAEGKTIASGLNDWQKKALKHDTYEKYVSHCNRYNYPHMDKRAWQRYKNAFDNMGTQDMAEASFPTVADAQKRAEQEKGTGKFTSKKSPDHPSGTIYTRKYNPKSGETDDTENVSTEKRGRGRPKKSAFEDMSTIDKMIAESFGELFEGTSRPINDPVSKSAPTAPGVGSGIRVTPMPALATTPKPATTAPGVGSIQGGVWTAKPPKAGEPGVPVPQGIDEGPLLDKIGTGIGKAAGSIVGGAANFGQAIKKGYQAGKSGDDDERAAASAAADTAATRSMGQMAPDRPSAPSQGMDPGTPQPQPTAFDPAPVAHPDLDEADAEMEGMRKLAGLKGDQPKLDRDQDGKLTRKDFEMLRKGLEEGGRDDYDEIQKKIQWLQGAPNYLSSGEAKETAYYTKDTDPVWNGYRDDTDEVGENLEVRANPAGASSAEQAKKIGAQFPQQNGKEPNLAYKIGEDEVEENLIVVPNLSGAGSVAAAKKLGAMMPAKPGEKDPISTNEEDMEEGGAFGLAVTNAKKDGIQPGETFKVGGKEYDLREGDITLNQMRRIAGLKECDMSPISGMASDMEKQQGNMNISTSQNSDGTKSVTITAAGDAASDLMQMLKLAGMGGGSAAPAAAEPEIVVVAQDGEETMEEEKDPRYQASTTPDEQVAPVQALTKGGNGDVAGQEKTMKPGGYQFGDNNLAMQESLSAQLMKEYNSIKVKK